MSCLAPIALRQRRRQRECVAKTTRIALRCAARYPRLESLEDRRLLSSAPVEYDGLADEGALQDSPMDFDPQQKVKWLQSPDLTPLGVDIRIDNADNRLRRIADDFRCDQRSLLTDVHFWGSWLKDLKGEIRKIHLSVHSDDPVGPGGSDSDNQFSQPDKLLWQMDFGREAFVEELVAVVPEGEFFWDPLGGTLDPQGDKQVWEYSIQIDPRQAFEQTGTRARPQIYWLDVGVELQPAPTAVQFGWKTRMWPEHFQDDAVIGPDPWIELKYPPRHPLGMTGEQNSIDMAFALTFEPVGPVEIDRFEWTVGGVTLQGPNGVQETVDLSGPTTATVYFEGVHEGDALDNDGNGRDEVATELTQLDLMGMSSLGPLHVTLNPAQPSRGQIEETTQLTPGTLDLPPFGPDGSTADSFFDVFFQIEIGGMTLYAAQPKRMRTVITHKPPAHGNVYQDCTPIQLLTADGLPTGFSITCAAHEPNPPLDFGDALRISPTGLSTYPTLLKDNGARHVIYPGFSLGHQIDPEPDGQPNATATGDDVNLVFPGVPFPPGDEDGVVLTSPLIPGEVAKFDVTVTNPAGTTAFLDAWIDLNRDGSFSTTPLEQFAVSAPVVNGVNTFALPLSLLVTPGPTYARFRLSSTGGLAPSGPAPTARWKITWWRSSPATILSGSSCPI